MAFKLNFVETIDAPASVVWDVITNTKDYPLWNEFIVACESTFEVGTPMIMQVSLPPSPVFTQKETIFEKRDGEFIEYGINQPLGILASRRQHIIKPNESGGCTYEAMFELRGPMSYLVRLALGKKLERGFAVMSSGIARRAEEIA